MAGVRKYDDLPPDEAARRAWMIQGISPRIHEDARRTVREVMPLLARALDRMPTYVGDGASDGVIVPPTQDKPQEPPPPHGDAIQVDPPRPFKWEVYNPNGRLIMSISNGGPETGAFVEQVRRKNDGLCIGHTGPESECACGHHAYVVTYY